MLSKIFNGKYLQRLDNIIQWQEKDVFKQESVSQHSYKVAIFARVLLEDIFGQSEDANVNEFKLEVITRALLHDWDESFILRDLSHEIKYNEYNGYDIRRALNSFVRYKVSKELKEGVKGVVDQMTFASEMMINNIISSTSIENNFVKVCDWLALIMFIKREMKLGNSDFEEFLFRAKENILKAKEILIKDLKLHFPNTNMNFSELENI